MTAPRSDRDINSLLEAWMHDVAPDAAPVPVLEEAFARTMAASQVRVYPWQRITRRSRRPRHLRMLSLAAAAVLLVGALGLGVFGGGSPVSPGPSPTPSPSPTASPTPVVPPPIAIVPTATIPVSGIQGLATDGTSVWVLTETGLVQRIDPATNKAGPGTQTGATTDLYNGISADENGVWVTDWDAAALYRLDPATVKVVAVIDAGLAPKGVLATATAVWVAGTHDGKVLRVDPATNKIAATVAVGPVGNSGPNWLASGLGSIWVSIPNNGTVARIDPLTNKVQATIAIPPTATPCGGFAIIPNIVWSMPCDSAQTMTRIDPATNLAVTTTPLPGQGNNPAVIGGVPWVSTYRDTGPGTLGRISATTNAVDLELTPGPTFGGGGDMVVAAGSVWAIDNGNGRVLRLPLAAFTPD